jgi:hypothetical protein
VVSEEKHSGEAVVSRREGETQEQEEVNLELTPA